MKLIIVSFVFAFIAVPMFAQDNRMPRFNALGESIGHVAQRSNTRLANYDSMILDDGHMRVYTQFLRRFEVLAGALRESEVKLNLLIRGNGRRELVLEERNNYARLIGLVEELRTEYDNWLRTVR